MSRLAARAMLAALIGSLPVPTKTTEERAERRARKKAKREAQRKMRGEP